MFLAMAERQHFQGLIFHNLLDAIDALVRADGRFSQLGVALGDGFNGVGELRFGKTAHLCDRIGKHFQLFGERLHDVIAHANAISLASRQRARCRTIPSTVCDTYITV
jgi:hypothetical protein